MRIVDEIQHLLRLAEDPGASSAERDLAMRRAEKLMVRHRLQPDQLHQDADIKILTITVTGGARLGLNRKAMASSPVLVRGAIAFIGVWRVP